MLKVKRSIVVSTLLLVTIVFSCDGVNMFSSNRKKAEKILGIELPKTCTDVKYSINRPNPDLAMYFIYIAMKAPKNDFYKIVKETQMKQYDKSIAVYFEDGWKMSGEKVSWWNPTKATPLESFAKNFGKNGWIIAKYEDGKIFVIATDSGEKEGTPGPW